MKTFPQSLLCYMKFQERLKVDSIFSKRNCIKLQALQTLEKVRNCVISQIFSISLNQAYCHMTHGEEGWTLIARLSNNDGKTWMRDDGKWWYYQQVAMGTTTDPSINTDMILPAFWLVSGRELKSRAVMIPVTQHCCRQLAIV